MVWILELRPSVTAFVRRWREDVTTLGRWRWIVRAVAITGVKREWVAQKYHRFQWRWAQPTRVYAQSSRRLSLSAQARPVLSVRALSWANRARCCSGRFSSA